MDEKVKRYIEKQAEPHKTLLLALRSRLMTTIDGCTEDYKWGVPVYDGGKFYIAAMKSRVHLGFATTHLTDDEIKTLEGTGKTMRHIKIHTMDDIADKQVDHFIKLVHERNV